MVQPDVLHTPCQTNDNLIVSLPHQLVEEGDGGHHPLQLQLEGPGGVVGVVVADEAPLGAVALELGVGVQLHVAVGH